MLLTLTSTTPPARDLGHLLRKHPDRLASFPLPFGTAHVFYPEASDARCTAALAIDVDPVGLVRGRSPAANAAGIVDAYVNDRPYAASSLLSVAIARVFGAALGGRSEQPELAERELQLTLTLSTVALGDDDLASRLFGPLGYAVQTLPVDVPPEDRIGAHRTIRLAATTTVQRVLTHVYVLVPVLDGEKHYWVGDEEVEKLLRFGGDWLPAHPEREFITRRYLKRAPGLARDALSRLAALDDAPSDSSQRTFEDAERALERPMKLQDRRIVAVMEELRAQRAATVADVGCGDGDLLVALAREPAIERICGAEVSLRELERAKLRLERVPLPASRRERIELLQSSILYTDRRLSGFDALTLLEVVEHIDPSRLDALSRTVFGRARPRTVILTTPNREYNVLFGSLRSGALRHSDHRFEWTRDEFRDWSQQVGQRFGYAVRHGAIGDEDATHGAPTQLAVFTCA